MKSRSHKTLILKPPSPVIEIRLGALAGAADFLKEIYISQGRMTGDQTLILLNVLTGEMDVSGDSVSKPRPRKYASVSRIADARNRARRAKYQTVRDRRKSV